MSPELESISRVRTLYAWLRKTGKTVSEYPRLGQLSETEIDDAKRFAVGMYPTPARWTARLYELAKKG
jgi:hypothetical protein